MINGKVKMFAFDGAYERFNRIEFFIFNDNNKTFSVNRKIGRYGKTIKRVFDTNDVNDVHNYLNMLKICDVNVNYTYMRKFADGGVVKYENLPKIKGDK